MYKILISFIIFSLQVLAVEPLSSEGGGGAAPLSIQEEDAAGFIPFSPFPEVYHLSYDERKSSDRTLKYRAEDLIKQSGKISEFEIRGVNRLDLLEIALDNLGEKKLALIIAAKRDHNGALTFRYHHATIFAQIENSHGFQFVRINHIDDMKEIMRDLTERMGRKIDSLFWAAHGSPTAMSFGSSGDFNMSTDLSELEEYMAPNAQIFLRACSVGSLLYKGQVVPDNLADHIARSFPGRKVVASKIIVTESLFRFSESGEMSFFQDGLNLSYVAKVPHGEGDSTDPLLRESRTLREDLLRSSDSIYPAQVSPDLIYDFVQHSWTRDYTPQQYFQFAHLYSYLYPKEHQLVLDTYARLRVASVSEERDIWDQMFMGLLKQEIEVDARGLVRDSNYIFDFDRGEWREESEAIIRQNFMDRFQLIYADSSQMEEDLLDFKIRSELKVSQFFTLPQEIRGDLSLKKLIFDKRGYFQVPAELTSLKSVLVKSHIASGYMRNLLRLLPSTVESFEVSNQRSFTGQGALPDTLVELIIDSQAISHINFFNTLHLKKLTLGPSIKRVRTRLNLSRFVGLEVLRVESEDQLKFLDLASLSGISQLERVEIGEKVFELGEGSFKQEVFRQWLTQED